MLHNNGHSYTTVTSSDQLEVSSEKSLETSTLSAKPLATRDLQKLLNVDIFVSLSRKYYKLLNNNQISVCFNEYAIVL
jgi:hypothetical protein